MTRLGWRKAQRAQLLSTSAPAALTAAATVGFLGLAAMPAAAQDATWLANPVFFATPGLGDFNDPTSWSTGTVPTGTAFFNTSTGTNLVVTEPSGTTVGGMTFNAGASNYTLTSFLRLCPHIHRNRHHHQRRQPVNRHGRIVLKNSSSAGSASITNGNALTFLNTSTAGNATITNDGIDFAFSDHSTAGSANITNNSGGNIAFSNTSTAGNATITNSGGLSFADTSTAGSATITNNLTGNFSFSNTSTAGNATITNFGGLTFQNTSAAGSATIGNSGALGFIDSSTAGSASINNFVGGNLSFNNSSTAGNSIITNSHNSGGLFFEDSSTAGSASITNNQSLNFQNTSAAGNAAITNNASVTFRNNSTGGNASIVNTATGTVDFSPSTGPAGDGKLSAGSIAGAGVYYLGSNQITVGGNNMSTTVSGVISDCGPTGHECSATTASGGGTLAGTGTIGNLQVVPGFSDPSKKSPTTRTRRRRRCTPSSRCVRRCPVRCRAAPSTPRPGRGRRDRFTKAFCAAGASLP